MAIGLSSCDRGCYIKKAKQTKVTRKAIRHNYPEYKPYKK